MSNGRGDLLDHVKNFYAANSKPGKTKAQLAGVIHRLLTQARPGIIRPEYTRKDLKRKALGGSGSNSKEEQDKNNKKHNPINAQRRKEANDLENRKTIDAQGLGHTMRSLALRGGEIQQGERGPRSTTPEGGGG
jgi:hypothetical protein